MAKPDEALMRVRYPNLPWANVDEALRQASYQEMRRMTDGLASSDKGDLDGEARRSTDARSLPEPSLGKRRRGVAPGQLPGNAADDRRPGELRQGQSRWRSPTKH